MTGRSGDRREFFRLLRGLDFNAAALALADMFPIPIQGHSSLAELLKKLLEEGALGEKTPFIELRDNHFSRRLLDPSIRLLEESIRHRTIGAEFDYLQNRVPDTLEATLNKVANMSVKKTKDVAVVASCRNEGPWLLEWIAHHRAAGASDIFLGYNDLTDESEALIQALARNEFIYSFENVVDERWSPQKKFINFCTTMVGLLNRYKWVFFIDIDEYIVPAERFKFNMREMLENIDLKQPSMEAACFHWKWYSSKNKFEWEDGLVTDRFQYANSESWVKTAAKTDFLWSTHHCHIAETIDPSKLVSSSGIFVQEVDGQVKPADYYAGQINHYFAKSFTEYALKKARGRGAAGLAGPQRNLSDFLWGQSTGRLVGPLPADLRLRVGSELKGLLSYEDIAAAHSNTVAASRRHAQRLNEEMGLSEYLDQLLSESD